MQVKVFMVLYFISMLQISYGQSNPPSDCDTPLKYSWNGTVVDLCEDYSNVIERFGPPDTIMTDLGLGEKVLWYKGVLYLVYRSNDEAFETYCLDTAVFGPGIKVFTNKVSTSFEVNETVEKVLSSNYFVQDNKDYYQLIGSHLELRLHIESDVIKSIRVNTVY